jgi:DNA-binding IclR family transcriptional regulator
MSSETVKKVLDALKQTEPQTPNEIADALGLNQKTVQSILLELVLNNSKVKYKKIGRYRVFWKV